MTSSRSSFCFHRSAHLRFRQAPAYDAMSIISGSFGQMAACTTHASVIVWSVSHQCLQPLIVVREHRRSAGGIHNARRDIILISVVPNAAVDYLVRPGAGICPAGKRSVAQPPRNAIHCYHALPAVGAHSSKKRDQRRFTAGKCGRLPSTRFPSFMFDLPNNDA